MEMYGACALLCAIGLFFIVMSYGASRAGGSGVPFTGAVFIAAGFLLTPFKWLALLALIDPGFPMIALMIKDNIDYKKAVPLFDKAFSDGGYQKREPDKDLTLDISVPLINETLSRALVTDCVMIYYIPRMFFAVVADDSGRFILLYKQKDTEIKALPFDEDNTLTVSDLVYKGKPAPVTFEIKNRSYS